MASSLTMSLSRRFFPKALAAAATAGSLRLAEAQSAAGRFQHGVASGDPLANRVILWTRVTPNPGDDFVAVEWQISDDPSLRRVLQRGLTYTNSGYDFTVKVDVARLQPGQTYYYRFLYQGEASPVGRTKTLPLGAVDRLRFAVCSCSNHPQGFFNSYRMIARRADLDAVFHLGDYIYEYAEGVYGRGAEIGRIPEPNREIVSLSDYRTRYAQYRRDPDLQEAHRQHPWIVVWDDHESTNDSWRNGAENHQPATEGGWDARRAVATQAWFEWMPVRENPSLGEGFEIYRRFRFGDLADVMMLDTRLTGRDEPAPTAAAVLANPNRSLLGEDQEAWLYRELLSSKARQAQWRFLGQQVMMGQLLGPDGIANPDQWDGYPAARGRLLSYLGANAINNVAVLTGDIHSSWGNEVSVNPFAPNFASQAVEFVTPAVSSPGIDDPAQAAGLAAQINATHPHVKFVELNRRGYLLVDVDRDRVQGEWYHVATIRERRAEEAYARGLAAASGQPRLIAASAASAPKANPPALAT